MQFDDVPKDVLAAAALLKAKMKKTREGVFDEKRVEYFKGKTAIATITEHKSKLGPELQEEEADDILAEMLLHGLFVRADRQDRFLHYHPSQVFDAESYYVWLYNGSQFRSYLIGLGLIALTFVAVLFPLWPATLRNIVYYLSIGCLGLLGLLFIIAIIRLILWIFSVIVLRRGFWLFPNLFADVGIIESFIPFYSWDAEEKSKEE